MAKRWYSITAAQKDKPAEISIFDAIGATWDGEGVTAKQFIADLKKIDASEINLFINSPGGNVMDGLAIYNALRSHGAKINVKVMGIAASAASFIAMAGDHIAMPENTFMMVHNPMSYAFGNANDMREVADTLDKIGSSLVGIYVSRSGKPESEVKALLDAETLMTATEAKDYGFADEVTATLKVSAEFDVEALPEPVRNVWNMLREPKPEPKPEPTATFAEQVLALVAGTDVEAYGPIFAVQTADIAAAKERITLAREVRSICAVAKFEGEADKFIRAGTPLAKVREELTNALAARDEAMHTEVSRRTTHESSAPSQPRAISTASIWAARQQQLKN